MAIHCENLKRLICQRIGELPSKTCLVHWAVRDQWTVPGLVTLDFDPHLEIDAIHLDTRLLTSNEKVLAVVAKIKP